MDVSTLTDGAWERGRLSLPARLRRLESKAWMIGQCAIAAAVAWVIAERGVRPRTRRSSPRWPPSCASGTSYGQRLRRVAEVSIGCAVGIGIADVFTDLFGRGAGRSPSWSPSRCRLRSCSTPACCSSTRPRCSRSSSRRCSRSTAGVSRIVDALIGGAVALVAATIVPGAPLRRPREEAAKVVARARPTAAVERARRPSDIDVAGAPRALNRARETEALLDDLRAAAGEGLEVIRSSPFRRGAKEHVRTMAELVGPLDRALRNTRVLIRRVVVSARLDETMPPDYLVMLDEIAEATDEVGRPAGRQRVARAAAANASSRSPRPPATRASR